jgi:hypothetical protein
VIENGAYSSFYSSSAANFRRFPVPALSVVLAVDAARMAAKQAKRGGKKRCAFTVPEVLGKDYYGENQLREDHINFVVLSAHHVAELAKFWLEHDVGRFSRYRTEKFFLGRQVRVQRLYDRGLQVELSALREFLRHRRA